MNLKRQSMIKEKIKDCIRVKFKSHRSKTIKKPFHDLLLGKDRMALYSFIHSLNTTLGIFYEHVAIALARDRFKAVESQVQLDQEISSEAHQQIETIMHELSIKERKPNRSVEVEEIRRVCKTETLTQVEQTQVDIRLEDQKGELFLIDLKTVKPASDHCREYKRTLLKWSAAELARNPNAVVNTMLGFPYNPYEPEPYKEGVLQGILDVKREVLVAEELWNFIGGEGTYVDLLDAFEQAGIELRDEIDEYFKQFS